MVYDLYLNGKEIATVRGVEAVYHAWLALIELANAIGGTADMVDVVTGEIVEHWEE